MSEISAVLGIAPKCLLLFFMSFYCIAVNFRSNFLIMLNNMKKPKAKTLSALIFSIFRLLYR